MNFAETTDHFANLAADKSNALRKSPTAFFVSAMMAGAYVGIGIVLIFSVGDPADPSFRKLVMGASFGIALTLVVFAGSELFTGHTMYMAQGWLRRKTTLGDLGKVWAFSWLGNLVGSALLGAIVVIGAADIVSSENGLLYTVAGKKMTAPALELVARAMLCNWLVCLALWTSARTKSDAAKCILIFWCLFAFIASGFEHSVANMTVFSMALLSAHPEIVTVGGMAHNLLWVTLGNAISGFLFMGVGYWVAAKPQFTDKQQ